MVVGLTYALSYMGEQCSSVDETPLPDWGRPAAGHSSQGSTGRGNDYFVGYYQGAAGYWKRFVATCGTEAICDLLSLARIEFVAVAYGKHGRPEGMVSERPCSAQWPRTASATSCKTCRIGLPFIGAPEGQRPVLSTMMIAPDRQRKVVPKIAKVMLATCLLFIASPAFCRKNKVTGVVPNRWALAAIKSYCINESDLSDRDRRIVEDFVTSESKPKHLLTKLPWKFAESCSEGDVNAEAGLEFVPLRKISISNMPTTPITPPQAPDAPLRLVLTIFDNSSGSLLYRTQSAPIDRLAQPGAIPGEPPKPVSLSVERDAVYHVFWALIDDLKAIHVSPRR